MIWLNVFLWQVDLTGPLCPIATKQNCFHHQQLCEWTFIYYLGLCSSLLLFMCIYQFSSVTQLCPTLCDPMNRRTPGLPIHHQQAELTQTSVHQVGDAIQPSHPPLSPSPLAPNPSQHQSLFQWVNSSHEVAKVLEFQLQHHSFQRHHRTDLKNGLVGSPCSPRDLQESSAAAASAAKSLQSCLTLCNPIDGSPTGSLVPGSIGCIYSFKWSLLSIYVFF